MFIEYIFIENLILNLIVMYIANIFLKKEKTKIKFIIFSLVFSIITCIIRYFEFTNFLDIVIKMICLKYIYSIKSIKEYIKAIIIFIYSLVAFISITIICTIILKLNLDNIIYKYIIYFISSILSCILTCEINNILVNNIKDSSLMYFLVIENIKFKVFLDTGNNLDDNIIIIDKNKYINSFKKLKIIGTPHKTKDVIIKGINNIDSYKGYIFEDVVIYNKIEKFRLNKVIVVLIDSNFKRFDGIISYKMFLNKLKGVSIC